MVQFFQDESGGVLAYGAVFAAVLLGMGALGVDIGRMSVLRTQMQNRADAGAMAGAVQLDGKDGARARARLMVEDAISARSGLAADGAELTVRDVLFYSEYGAVPVAATSDLDAKFIEVVQTPKRIDFMLAPVLRLLGGVGPAFADMGARAVAGPSSFICHAPPLMLCNLAEADPSFDTNLPANFGRQVILKAPQAGGGPWAPGNFGLLSLPDGSSGAADIEAALAAVEPADCYTLDVTTATGSKTNKVKNGINARFDLPGGLPFPAPNVINYPRDGDIVSGMATRLGNGDWDLDAYWDAKHNGAALPSPLTGATRYQVYLYEQGLTFARGLVNPATTLYPAPTNLPEGFELISPPGAQIPVTSDPSKADDPDYDGVPSSDGDHHDGDHHDDHHHHHDDDHHDDDDGDPSTTVAANGAARRLVQVAILNCGEEGVNGHGTYPTNGNYVELFITEHVKDPPDSAIYAEIVRPLTPLNSPDFHANVRLVR